MMVKGSTFKKWELHIHTPESYQNDFRIPSSEREKYKDDIWEKYIDELEKITDIAVLCPTDYFSIDGYKKILAYREKGRLNNFELILPNIELRLNTYVGRERKRLNYHLIFSDEVDVETIERSFLNALHIKTPNTEKRNLSRGTLEEIGRVLKEQHGKFRGKNDYSIGCEQAAVDLDEILKILKESPSLFKGKYLRVLSEPEWSLLDWDAAQDHLVRKTILIESDLIFSSNEKTIQWALGYGPGYKSPEDFEKEFTTLKPCINGSDAHRFEDLCKPALDRYCWIKADPTFEGLKQILYEPEERVVICSNLPEPRKSIFTIDKVEIPECKINEELIISSIGKSLNPSLVTIIGGKGSGKTALLDLIANCFEDRCTRNRKGAIDKNSFVQRIEKDDPDLNIKIKFLGNDVDDFSKRYSEEDFFKDSNITYIPQGRIEELSSDREELDKKTQEIIFKNKDVEDSGLRNTFERIETEVEDHNANIRKKIGEISDLEVEASTKKLKELVDSKTKLEGVLKDKESELAELLKGISQENQEDIDKSRQRLRELSEWESASNELDEQIYKLTKLFDGTEVSLSTSIAHVNRGLKDGGFKEQIPNVSFESQKASIEDVRKKIKGKSEACKKEKKEISSKLAKIDGFTQTQSAITGVIEEINKQIKELGVDIRNLEEKRELITKLQNNIEELFEELVECYFNWKLCYENIIGVFSSGKSEILSGVDFKSAIFCDVDAFVKQGNAILHGGKVKTCEIEDIGEALKAILNVENSDCCQSAKWDTFLTGDFGPDQAVLASSLRP